MIQCNRSDDILVDLVQLFVQVVSYAEGFMIYGKLFHEKYIHATDLSGLWETTKTVVTYASDSSKWSHSTAFVKQAFDLLTYTLAHEVMHLCIQ